MPATSGRQIKAQLRLGVRPDIAKNQRRFRLQGLVSITN